MILKYFYLLALFLWLFEVSTCKKKKTYELLKTETCLEYSNLSTKLIKLKIKNRRNGNNSAELIWEVVKKIEGDLQAIANVLKCDATGSPESCEYIVRDLKIKKVCEKISMKNQFWSSFVEDVRPPMYCPIEPVGNLFGRSFPEPSVLTFFSDTFRSVEDKVILFAARRSGMLHEC